MIILILILGPHADKYDGHIFFDTYNDHPMYEWEYGLGDGHYVMFQQIVTLPPSSSGEDPSYYDMLDTELIGHYRSRVEHWNRKLKFHSIFQQPWRASLELLEETLKILIHTQNLYQKKHLSYHPFGPWSHDPELLQQ